MRGNVLYEIKAHLIIMFQDALLGELNSGGNKFSKATGIQHGTYQVFVQRIELMACGE